MPMPPEVLSEQSESQEMSSGPMTIVQVASAFSGWGGMEIHLLNLGVQLQKRGHRVIVAAKPDGWVMGRATTLGLETFAADVRRQQDWSDYSRYRAFLQRESVDVIHAHTNWDAIVPAVAARMAGVPVAMLSWHLPFPFRNYRGGRFLLGLYYRMITVSKFVRDMHVSHGVPADKIEVIHHGTDVAQFQAVTEDRKSIRESWNLTPDQIAVGIAGRVSPEKGHRDLFQALRLITESHPSVRLVVIGDGPDEPLLRELAAEWNLADRIIFTGFRSDVNNAISALDIMTVPSTWDEPCSAVIQQAMALSRPVIGTRTGGTPEMIVDGGTGLLVPASDPQALGAAIATLASDAALRQRLGEAGVVRASEHFTLDHMTDRIERLYRQAYAPRMRRQAKQQWNTDLKGNRL